MAVRALTMPIKTPFKDHLTLSSPIKVRATLALPSAAKYRACVLEGKRHCPVATSRTPKICRRRAAPRAGRPKGTRIVSLIVTAGTLWQKNLRSRPRIS
jgi:hypothetical protein